MPRRIFKRYMPAPETLRQNKSLSWLGEHLHNPNLWHLSRRSAARAFAIGLFCAFLPIPGQMVVAAFLALWLGGNLAVSVGLVWLTNPITMPAIFFSTYKLGAWILGAQPVEVHWCIAGIEAQIAAIWWPLLFGSTLCGIILSGIGYTVINRLWIWHVQSNRKRALKRRLKS